MISVLDYLANSSRQNGNRMLNNQSISILYSLPISRTQPAIYIAMSWCDQLQRPEDEKPFVCDAVTPLQGFKPVLQ
jgi:hypothetical protein